MKYKSLGEEVDVHPENTIAKQIKEPVDKAKGRHFKICPNMFMSSDVTLIAYSPRSEKYSNLLYWEAMVGAKYARYAYIAWTHRTPWLPTKLCFERSSNSPFK